MLTDKEMLEIAKKYVKKINGSSEDELIIIEDITVEKPYGNIYYYEFKRFIETGNNKYSVAICAPFLVEKEMGRVVNFSTSGHLENHLKIMRMVLLNRVLEVIGILMKTGLTIS